MHSQKVRATDVKHIVPFRLHQHVVQSRQISISHSLPHFLQNNTHFFEFIFVFDNHSAVTVVYCTVIKL